MDGKQEKSSTSRKKSAKSGSRAKSKSRSKEQAVSAPGSKATSQANSNKRSQALTPTQESGAEKPANLPQLPSMQFVPEKMQAIQKDYLEELGKVMVSKPEMVKMASQDRRFNNPTWLDSNFAGLAALYVLNAKTISAMTDAVQTDPKTHARLKFMTQQWIDAASPANFFATNPEVHQKMLDSKGESLRAGIENLVSDMRKGRISQTDESAFEIGKNVAMTAGDVVFQNVLFQLIQYKPTTEKVGAVPLLMVPPVLISFTSWISSPRVPLLNLRSIKATPCS